MGNAHDRQGRNFAGALRCSSRQTGDCNARKEFSLASALLKARTDAGLTQEELAGRMNTTQSVIARMESGRVKPSSRMLQRFAKATRMRMQKSASLGIFL